MYGFHIFNRKGYIWILVGFFVASGLLVASYAFYPNIIFSPDWFNSFCNLHDESLITICIFLCIPTSTFIVFYSRRYGQSKDAQQEIKRFVDEQRNIMKGFKKAFSIDITPNSPLQPNE
jgi:hypothetical protein